MNKTEIKVENERFLVNTEWLEEAIKKYNLYEGEDEETVCLASEEIDASGLEAVEESMSALHYRGAKRAFTILRLRQRYIETFKALTGVPLNIKMLISLNFNFGDDEIFEIAAGGRQYANCLNEFEMHNYIMGMLTGAAVAIGNKSVADIVREKGDIILDDIDPVERGMSHKGRTLAEFVDLCGMDTTADLRHLCVVLVQCGAKIAE